MRNQTRGAILCARAVLAHNFYDRQRGLLGRDGLASDEGIIIEASPFVPVMWMHTWFMRFPIDIVFLGRDNAVLRIDASLKPWRFSAMVFGASRAVELIAGAALRTGTAVGDLISLEPIHTR